MRFSLLLVFLLGCGQDICLRHSDCAARETCTMGTCTGAAADGGVIDADADVDAAVDEVTSKRCETKESGVSVEETKEDCDGDGSSN